MSTQDLRPSNLRRFAFYSSFLLFLATTAVVLLYGSGYVVHFPSHAIIATGSLLIKTQPTDTHIVVAGETHNGSTPLRVPRLVPRTVSVILTKEGYFPWQKQLVIEAKKTTFIDTVLFKNNQPEILETSPSSRVNAITPDASMRIGFTPGSNTIFVHEGALIHTIALPAATTFERMHATWSPDGARALLTFTATGKTSSSTPTYSYIFSTARPREISSSAIETMGYVPLRWDTAEPWLLIVRDTNNLPYTLHSITQEREPLSITNSQSTKEQRNPPFTMEQFEVVVGDQETLFFNSVEIWRKQKKEDGYSLIMRSSETITRAMFIPNAPYAAVLVGGKLQLVEYDDRDARNSFVLASAYIFEDFAVTKNGQEIIAFGKDAQKNNQLVRFIIR